MMKIRIGYWLAGWLVIASVVGCDSAPEPTHEPAQPELAGELRQKVNELKLEPIEAPPTQEESKVELGQNLFFDPLLSGSRDVSCATCHQMSHGTSDDVPLSSGPHFEFDEDGNRVAGKQHGMTPRKSPPVFHRGHEDFRTMFWDGRLERLEDGRIVMHERSYPEMRGNYYRVMPEGIDDLLAAQAAFPVHSRNEMRGADGTPDAFGHFNEVATSPKHDLEGTWRRIMDRVLAIDDYRHLFARAYPDEDLQDLSYVHAVNAISAFEKAEFSPTDSRWDQFLGGDDEALTDAEVRGAKLFYGEAGCADCHGGTLMTDQKLYNIGVPPITSGPEPLDNLDRGAAHKSHAGPAEDFHFRTPPLRNVELTAPYMHNGAYQTLEDVIRHKIDPVESLWDYDASHLSPPYRRHVHTGEEEIAQVEATISSQALETPKLSDDEIDDLVAFMHSLTSPEARDLTDRIPESVPSGLDLNLPSSHR